MTESDSTTATGLFHYAASYRAAADVLGIVKLDATHPDAAQQFLLCHAIELYLKAYLRSVGLSLIILRDLGHDFRKLAKEYLANGGSLDDEDEQVLRLLGMNQQAIRVRYIETGYFTNVRIEALQRTAASLHEVVGYALKIGRRSKR